MVAQSAKKSPNMVTLLPTLTEDESFQSYFLKYGTILAYLLIFVLFSFQ